MANNAAYIGFTRALIQLFDSAGLEYKRDKSTATGVVENAKWVDFQFQLSDGSMHKLYVPKNKVAVGKLHTTIEFPTQIEGVLDLPSTDKRPEYKNGAIRSHLSSVDPERVAKLVISAIRRNAPVPQKRVAQPRQQAQASQSQVTPNDDRESESWSLSEKEIGEVDAELIEAGRQGSTGGLSKD